MPTSSGLTAALAAAVPAVRDVTADLKARPDFNTRPDLKPALEQLTAYLQQLQTVQAQSDPSSETLIALQDSSGQAARLLQTLIDTNTKQSKLGQLNTARTAPPEVNQASNAKIAIAQDAVGSVIAETSALTATNAPSPAPAPSPGPSPSPSPTPSPAPAPAPAPSPAPSPAPTPSPSPAPAPTPETAEESPPNTRSADESMRQWADSLGETEDAGPDRQRTDQSGSSDDVSGPSTSSKS